MKKKLKLTKLTVANLNRVTGGKPPCYCEADPFGSPNGVFNRDNGTVLTICFPTCVEVSCPIVSGCDTCECP